MRLWDRHKFLNKKGRIWVDIGFYIKITRPRSSFKFFRSFWPKTDLLQKKGRLPYSQKVNTATIFFFFK